MKKKKDREKIRFKIDPCVRNVYGVPEFSSKPFFFFRFVPERY